MYTLSITAHNAILFCRQPFARKTRERKFSRVTIITLLYTVNGHTWTTMVCSFAPYNIARQSVLVQCTLLPTPRKESGHQRIRHGHQSALLKRHDCRLGGHITRKMHLLKAAPRKFVSVDLVGRTFPLSPLDNSRIIVNYALNSRDHCRSVTC